MLLTGKQSTETNCIYYMPSWKVHVVWPNHKTIPGPDQAAIPYISSYPIIVYAIDIGIAIWFTDVGPGIVVYMVSSPGQIRAHVWENKSLLPSMSWDCN